jgi:hypothetical protein
VALVAALLVVGGAAVAIQYGEAPAPVAAFRAPNERPTLALLTSLPLLFSEQFSLSGGGSAALSRIEQRYNVVPIGIADEASLDGKPILLMAHPRAQPAEVLVELDRWVRGGGRVLLLADPKLDWHSDLPLGDPLRPPPYFADTGLLGHWGLALDGPDPDGPASVATERGPVLAASPGRLTSRGSCKVVAERLVARCVIGRGKATIIGDADFLNVAGEGALDGPTAGNLDLLVDELALLEGR